MEAQSLVDAKRKASERKKDFDETAWWSAKAKWRRAARRVFELKEAADLARDILARDPQWLDVKVQPILKAPK